MSETFTVSRPGDGPVTLVFTGRLDETAARAAWDRVMETVDAAFSEVVIDLAAVAACDGAGLALLTEADRRARARGGSPTVNGASDELAELLRMAHHEGDDEPAPRRAPGLVTGIGNRTAELLDGLRALVAFIGDLTRALVVGTVTLRPGRIAEIIGSCTRVGADAVAVVSLLGGLVGFILAVQSVNALQNIGASSLVPMVVGFATLREFGPLIAAIILAGRSGSAFAAEIGTMKVTEELDAYTTFALDPMIVLVYPRVVAGTLVLPLLTLYSILLAIVGGYVPMVAEGYTFAAYLTGVIESVDLMDLVQALVKGFVFGVIFSSIGCFHGLRTGSGADAVGRSTTRAVVWGIVAILVADSIISGIFYSLGL
ncbi:MAG: ABC transporter permease [Planctomycetota bacterium]|jgi:phospholipid/cholesterol/gamma-HCH transport system permease protein